MLLSKDNRGIAGFFEDIPALIVVVIAIGMFTVIMVHAYAGYVAQQNALRMYEDCREFTQSIRTYDSLIYQSQEGMFDVQKMETLTNETLEYDFNRTSLGFDYQILIRDVSDYPKPIVKSFGTFHIPPNIGKITITSSINIRVSSDEIHAAQLIVTIWSWR